uniref:50S ribosomal protein L33, chloroplastic n=1 Tax=Pometia pinnata TaxID=557028 RepID=A0A6M8AY75_9ROSI|nr:ribosomal protein L33 [Pometia pinnata]QKD76181.1 ribosomal protein L33 [Pometia pinnata]
MAKGKDARVRVILECTCCVRNDVNKESTGISRYITQKNRHNTPSRLELSEKILSLLFQAYNSWGDKEIDID